LPSISVITPAYIDSQEKLDWLAEAINSVAAQTFIDWEMIVVDDESPIDIGPIVDQFDDRVRRVRASRRQGPAACRNTGVALSLSEAVIGLDADDQFPRLALEIMYQAWQGDKQRIVYGDLQRLERAENGRFRLGRTFSLPEYTFERVMDLNGIIPVTALHSKECHKAAGGWKPELDAGLEDVEKWVAAGKAGFCGFHVPEITLYYRQHQTSRAYAMRMVNRRMSEMRKRIQDKHADIYVRGEFPMGCCGGGSSRGSTPTPRPAGGSRRAATLNQFAPSEKIWVEYRGKRTAAFGMIGQFTGINYQIHGPGYRFEIHTSDSPKFRRSGRGKDFMVGVGPPPDAPAPEPPKETPAYQASSPQLAEIERLDEVAERAGVATAHGQPAPGVPDLPPIPASEWQPEAVTPEDYALDVMELGALEDVLEAEGWNVLKLAQAEPGELTPYKGIGPVRAGQIIAKARDHLGWETK
jgi:GT2 family glycosyltransferase